MKKILFLISCLSVTTVYSMKRERNNGGNENSRIKRQKITSPERSASQTINALPDEKDKKLQYAAMMGRIEEVRRLLQEGAGVNFRGWHGLTALHCAAFDSSEEMVALLLEHNANLEARDELGKTVLHLVAQKNIKIAKLLIEEGADVNAQDEFGYTPLHVAAQWGLTEMVKLLIDKGANLIFQNNFYDTPLHLAAFWGYTEIAKLLIDGGADINAQHQYKRDGQLEFRFAPLHEACLGNQAKMVEFLLEEGANKYVVKGYFKTTPLDTAKRRDGIDIKILNLLNYDFNNQDQ